MTAYRIAYRARVYAPRSIDPTETTVLTPAAGAPHADPFQVATITGLAGYQPYLDAPRGRNGRIAPLTRKLDVGEWTFPLIDKRVAADDTHAGLKRWLTAFLGNVKGQPRLAGLRVEVDESIDNGAIWTLWRTGRITRLSIGPVMASLSLREITDEAKMPVFVGNPHSSVTYAARQSLCPIGLMGSDFGTIKAVTPLKGTATNGILDAVISLDAASRSRRDNLVTRQLVGASAPDTVSSVTEGPGIVWPDYSGPLRARIKHLTGANAGQTGDYKAAGQRYASGPNGKSRLVHISVLALPTDDLNYLPLPATGVSVEITLWTDTKVSKDNPLFINDVHFATLLQALCDGKFGYLYRVGEAKPASKNYGDPKRSVPLVTTGPTINGTMFQADDTYPKQRFIVTEMDELIGWVEKNLLKPLNVALYPNENGALVLADMRLPASLSGIPVLTETDLARDQEQGDWSYDRENAITRIDFTWYSDRVKAIEDIEKDSNTFPDIPPGGLDSFDHPFLVLDVGQADIGDKAYEVDAPGFRTLAGETLQSQDRAAYLEGKLLELANQFRRPLGWGMVELPVTLRRSGAVITPAGLALVTFQHVPDPTTNQRGGTRLVRALEVSPSGPSREVRFLDLGVNVIAIAPTLAQPAQEANNTFAGVTSVLTLNASGQAAEVRYAVTDTSVGAVPADTSPLWTIAGRFTASGTVTIRNLVPNQRVWVQGRTLPDYVDSHLPSAWVNAGGTGRVDTAALPAPSAPASSLITGKSFRVSWTNGATDLATELLLATPVGDAREVVARIPPGSTFFDFPGTTGVDILASTTYRVGIRHAFVRFGQSAEVTIDVTTSASPTAAPTTGGFQALVGIP